MYTHIVPHLGRFVNRFALVGIGYRKKFKKTWMKFLRISYFAGDVLERVTKRKVFCGNLQKGVDKTRGVCYNIKTVARAADTPDGRAVEKTFEKKFEKPLDKPLRM
ncbi:MAG: hypothetical protein IJX53_00910 [Clostridia bacterium]|nr:hypothetical protein [Clostridia bacterium]